ncbi:MAG: hypothetical protein WD278_12840, partial [Pirellulales bacterium]
MATYQVWSSSPVVGNKLGRYCAIQRVGVRGGSIGRVKSMQSRKKLFAWLVLLALLAWVVVEPASAQ